MMLKADRKLIMWLVLFVSRTTVVLAHIPVPCLNHVDSPTTILNGMCLNCLDLSCQDSEALGMESGDILDSQLSASSKNNQVNRARLNGDKAWRPDKDDETRWIQVLFSQITNVIKIATQGRPDGNNDEYTSVYTVEFTVDHSMWHSVLNDEGNQVRMSQILLLHNTGLNIFKFKLNFCDMK